jgi:crossover junction endodeoxyribonuclease RusA
VKDYLIRLGWPARCLHPNSRVDRRRATESRQKARAEGWAEAKRRGLPALSEAHVEVTFYPPDKRRRDVDGMFSSIKSHLDGIANAMDVDDAGWTFTLRRGDPVKGGAVLLHFQSDAMIQVRGEIS